VNRVLVVEDDSMRARAARLRRHGLDVVTAAEAEEGLRIAKIPPPADVIVVDLATLKSGMDVARAFGSEPATAAIPVLLQSDATSDAFHK
jgi:DNA-binding response OmpR family regulator